LARASGEADDVSPGTNRSHPSGSGHDEWITSCELLRILPRSNNGHRLYRLARPINECAGHEETSLGVPPARSRDMLFELLARNVVERRVIDLEEDDVEWRIQPDSTYSARGSADEATAKLAHDRILLHARGSDRDLAAHRSVTAQVHLRQEAASQRRQIREVPNGTTDGGTPRLVLTPDVVHRLARNRDPAARFAGELDHASRVRLDSSVGHAR